MFTKNNTFLVSKDLHNHKTLGRTKTLAQLYTTLLTRKILKSN